MVFTTDAGGDIAKARRLLHQIHHLNDRVMVFDGDCLAHVYALIAKNVLADLEYVLIDCMPNPNNKKLRFFSALCTIMHTWRDNAATIWTQWQHIYGPESAYKAGVYNVPPRPVQGRWGSTSAAVRFLLQKPLDEMVRIFSLVVSGRAYYIEASSGNSGSASKTDHLDETAVDERDSFVKTMGKWSTSSWS